MAWPGKLAAGRTYDFPVGSLDVFPTALALAGLPMPTNKPYDGENLMPFLLGANTNSPHDKLFWRMGGGSALAAREGDLKLIRLRRKPEEVYDLASDLSESSNLAEVRTNELKQLDSAVNSWNKQLVPPAFPGLAGHAKSAVEP
jgi:arylsulfatase A-like enzyme